MSSTELPPRFWELFFEVYEHLPRQGPGNSQCVTWALELCQPLPERPIVLDLGCGSGHQTLKLADLLAGEIIAIDNHAPFIERLNEKIHQMKLSDRVSAQVGDMAHVDLPAESVDLIWSEGALYSIGLHKALQVCSKLLRPGGFLAFTDAIWCNENPPSAVKVSFDLDYPGMGRLEDDLAMISECGFEIVGHFTLPDEAWWDDFYTPMEAHIDHLRDHYTGDPEALAILNQIAEEPAMHRRYSSFYAYEFFIARKPAGPASE